MEIKRKTLLKLKNIGVSTKMIAKIYHLSQSMISRYLDKNWKKKRNARYKINHLVKNGTINKQKCIFNNSNCHGRIESHHYLGYEKEHQLDVLWVCVFHHNLIEPKIKN